MTALTPSLRNPGIKNMMETAMSISPANIEQLRHAVLASLHKHWALYLVEGIVLIGLGAATVVVPTIATIAVTILLGWLLLISGVVGLFTTLWTRGVPGFWWSLVSAILAIVVGALLIGRPISGAFSLTYLLIAFFVIEGAASIMFAIDHRRELPGAWGWMVASGLVDLVLAAVIIALLPAAAAWLLGLVVGINLAFGGVALIAMALQARQINPSASTEI
jgi:uncharacterized membrane protein HdeD (DUF308 family)